MQSTPSACCVMFIIIMFCTHAFMQFFFQSVLTQHGAITVTRTVPLLVPPATSMGSAHPVHLVTMAVSVSRDVL